MLKTRHNKIKTDWSVIINRRKLLKERKEKKRTAHNNYIRNYQRELRGLRKSLRRCIYCDKDLLTIKFVSCWECKLKNKRYHL